MLLQIYFLCKFETRTQPNKLLTMSYIQIPDSELGILRALTAEEISVYQIDAGPGGTWNRLWYESARPELRDYQFHLRNVTADELGLYYLTITKRPVRRPIRD